MVGPPLQVGDNVVLERQHLQQLLSVLTKRGYRIVGPTVRDRAIILDELGSVADLPAGWTDEQDGGTYRLKKRADEALFGYVVGPHSWKKFLLQPQTRLWQARRVGSAFEVLPGSEETPRFAFIGARSCDLHAIAIQDKVFVTGEYADPSYRLRRENIFVVAVNCGQAGGTCFCVSMKTGPKVTFGFDLALTEILGVDAHYFLVEVGTELGVEVLCEVSHREAREDEKAAAETAIARCSGQMGRSLDTTEIKELLYRNYEHPRWDDVAGRCLTCGNCTMVCPTCFCTTVEDFTDLSGEHAERRRRMDVCFTMDFSYIHGGSIRSSAKGRYRQWMIHKLATWIDQFGVSGCIGCGRCITWCPVAIDITEEARAIRESESRRREVI
jgi:ferredoxin